jgi:hypothetical protein
MTTTTPILLPPVYHRTVDQVLLRILKTRAAVTALRGQAEAGEADQFTELLHAAALQLVERHLGLARAIKHFQSDLEACSTELADGRCAEHLLIGRGDLLAVLAHRHRDTLDRLEELARLWARNKPSLIVTAAPSATT